MVGTRTSGALSSLAQDVLSTLAILLISRRSFQCCRPGADPGFFLGLGASQGTTIFTAFNMNSLTSSHV